MVVNIRAVFWKGFTASDSSTFSPVDVSRACVFPVMRIITLIGFIRETHIITSTGSFISLTGCLSVHLIWGCWLHLAPENLPFSRLLNVNCTSAVISSCRTNSCCSQTCQYDTRLWLIWNVKPHGRRVSIFGHKGLFGRNSVLIEFMERALLNQLEGNILDSV